MQTTTSHHYQSTAGHRSPVDDQLYDLLQALVSKCEAIEAYAKAIELDPHFAYAYSAVGIVLRAQNKLDLAVAAAAPGGAGWHPCGSHNRSCVLLRP